MIGFYGLVLKSLWRRRVVAGLTMIGIAVSVALLAGVQRVRQEAHDSFANTVTGADLLVGARTGPVNLLLSAIFHMGDTSNAVSYATYQHLAQRPGIAWTVPISLGDTHRGFRVLGTNNDYFAHYAYGDGRHLAFARGHQFQGGHDAILGSAVARQLHYALGQKIIVSHGAGEVSFVQHDAFPFFVVGVLRPTGTPVDRTVHITLEGVRGMHEAAETHAVGVGVPALSPEEDEAREAADPFSPMALTGFLVGLKSPSMTFVAQRVINGYRGEALTAIIPGATLEELWESLGVAEQALTVISGFVVFAGLLGMMTAILTSLNERRREMAVLRSVGARAAHVFLLLMGEVFILAIGGIVLGVAALDLGLLAGGPLLESRFGIFIAPEVLTATDVKILALVLIAALLMGVVPAWRAYRNTLADGLAATA
jgi:putative ABC transport system permease protein